MTNDTKRMLDAEGELAELRESLRKLAERWHGTEFGLQLSAAISCVTQPSFTCPVCQMTSFNPNDLKHGYCGNCHEFTGVGT
jgi:hypothetical protein